MGAWVENHTSAGQWLQVNFDHLMNVTSIQIQGCQSSRGPEWVTEYTVSYCKEKPYKWQNYYRENRRVKVL